MKCEGEVDQEGKLRCVSRTLKPSALDWDAWDAWEDA